jgi:hypothetical protein
MGLGVVRKNSTTLRLSYDSVDVVVIEKESPSF